MTTRRSSLSPLVLIAGYHEAGHALACLWQRFWVDSIDVYRHSPGAGATNFQLSDLVNPYRPAANPGCAVVAWQTELGNAKRLMRVLLAGPLAEANATGTPMRSLGSIPDLQACHEIVRHLYRYWQALPDEADIDWPGARIVNATRDEVRRWIRRPANWEQIQRSAIYLARCRTLTGEQFAEFAIRKRGQQQLRLASSTPSPFYRTEGPVIPQADRR